MRIAGIILLSLGLLLIIDQLWLFGIPFGPILPDLTIYDPTGSPLIHHWMLGIPMVICGFFLIFWRKK